MAQEDYFPRVVTLRQDTDQSMVGNDQQGANTVLGHLLNRFIDRLIGRYRLDSVLDKTVCSAAFEKTGESYTLKAISGQTCESIWSESSSCRIAEETMVLCGRRSPSS